MPLSTAHPWLRTVGCVTTTRADYGIYRPLLAALARDGRFRVVRFAGGTHLRSEFGRTLDQVQADPFGEVVTVDYLIAGDEPADLAASAGAALAQFGRAFADHGVDMLFLLGDRYEMLAAALGGVLNRIPLAHLYGGDTTAGSYDEGFRHAISKLAAVHFPALPEHAERLRQAGEAADRIFVVGSLSVDALSSFSPLSRQDLAAVTGLSFDGPTLVVGLHPETLGRTDAAANFGIFAEAVTGFEGEILLIGPNADEGHCALRDKMHRFVDSRPRTRFVASLSQEQYWSCLHYAAALVGNSSSGVIEAPSLQLPVVNVGMRQAGRRPAGNVVNAPWDAPAIRAALRRVLDPAFRRSLGGITNPYGDGRAAERVISALEGLPRPAILLDKSQFNPTGDSDPSDAQSVPPAGRGSAGSTSP